MNRLELLNEILDKTIYITSALKSGDLDIINNLLDERELLMKQVDNNDEENIEKHLNVLKRIKEVDSENQKLILILKSKIDVEEKNLKFQRNKMIKTSKATKKYIQGSEMLESTFNKTR